MEVIGIERTLEQRKMHAGILELCLFRFIQVGRARALK